MRLLLDSHTLIWLYMGNPQLSQAAKNSIAHSTSICYVSVATVWEMAIKIKLGKLSIGAPLHLFVEELVQNGIQLLPIEVKHLLKTQDFPFHHRDPFDRLLAAQAIIEKMDLVSADTIMDSYFETTSIKRIW